MGWDARGYYYRVFKVHGRVVRQYVAGGEAGAIAEDIDGRARRDRAEALAASRARIAEQAALEAQVKAADEALKLVAHAALGAAGYRQHKRGEWRKKRGRKKE